jgi:AcrR family transcriptional regulator
MNIVHNLSNAILNIVQEAVLTTPQEKSPGEKSPRERSSHDMTTQERRASQRERLIDFAERRIAAEGLKGLRARDLAVEMGCAVGALYNLVADLDELVLLVAGRTARDLGAALDMAAAEAPADASGEMLLAAWARAYFRFARENEPRWRALFEYHMPLGSVLPVWFEEEQSALFARLEDRLAPHLPGAGEFSRQIKARVLFSAIHGIVTLGLEDKFTAMPATVLDDELDAFVHAYVRGLRGDP